MSGPSGSQWRIPLIASSSIVHVLSLVTALCCITLNPSLSPLAGSVQAYSHHHHPFSAEAHSYPEHEHINTTHDLLIDTGTSSFNFSDWICLDRYLNGYEEYELERLLINFWESPPKNLTCKCFINSRCVKNTGADPKLKNNLFLWFRCYGLDDLSLLHSFVEVLASEKLLKKIYDDERSQTTKACLRSEKNITLRTDLIRNNHSSKLTFEFIDKLNSQTNFQLESLSIRESAIDSIPQYLFSKGNNLKTLNLTRNLLTEFNSKELFISKANVSIVNLDLSHNRLNRVDLSLLVSLKSINLSYNNLSSLAKSELSEEVLSFFFKSLQNGKKKPLLDFNLAGNPWVCNGSLNWLIDFVSGIVRANGQIFENEQHLDLFQTDEPECNGPHEAKMFPFSVWKSVKETSICQKCDCHLEDKYAMVGYRYTLINCTNRNLDYLPTELPMNAKIIDLSNNRIRKLSTAISRDPKLSLWRHVNKIILQNNSLDSIDGLDQIQSIVFLDISGNLLTEIPYHILDPVLNVKFDKIRIGNNPFTCDCNTVKMQKWLQNNYRLILDIANVRCGYMRTDLTKNESNIAAQNYNDRFHNREILKINNLELCPSIGSVELFDILNCLLAIGIIFLLGKVTYDYFWQKRTGKLPRFFKLNV